MPINNIQLFALKFKEVLRMRFINANFLIPSVYVITTLPTQI